MKSGRILSHVCDPAIGKCMLGLPFPQHHRATTHSQGEAIPSDAAAGQGSKVTGKAARPAPFSEEQAWTGRRTFVPSLLMLPWNVTRQMLAKEKDGAVEKDRKGQLVSPWNVTHHAAAGSLLGCAYPAKSSGFMHACSGSANRSSDDGGKGHAQLVHAVATAGRHASGSPRIPLATCVLPVTPCDPDFLTWVPPLIVRNACAIFLRVLRSRIGGCEELWCERPTVCATRMTSMGVYV
eukprot:365159-Chlamydomonas_euryale.AAC.32